MALYVLPWPLKRLALCCGERVTRQRITNGMVSSAKTVATKQVMDVIDSIVNDVVRAIGVHLTLSV